MFIRDGILTHLRKLCHSAGNQQKQEGNHELSHFRLKVRIEMLRNNFNLSKVPIFYIDIVHATLTYYTEF